MKMHKNRKPTKTIEYYWNCECPDKYIHSRYYEGVCGKCGAVGVDQPDSLSSEVIDMLSHKKGNNKRR